MGRFRAIAVLVSTGATFLATSLVGPLPNASASVFHEWTLSGVTFDDGGTLSGTLVIADDGSLYSEDVTTAGGSTGTYGTFNYNGTTAPLNGDGPANGWYPLGTRESG